MDIPEDPALQQFISKDEYESMDNTFQELASSGKNLTRLPQKKFDRDRIVEAFQEAFELVGGVPRLALYAHNNYGEFLKIYGKLLPAANMLQHTGQMEITIKPALSRSKLDDIPPEKALPTPQELLEKKQSASLHVLPTPQKKQGGNTF